MFDLVRAFEALTADNDPHGEHDFGNFAVVGRKLFWKIYYYDAAMGFGSKDPPETTRILANMLASEY